MNRFLRTILIMGLALLVPIVPFFLLGEQLEGKINEWLQAGPSSETIGWATVIILTSDIFLPVPSSLVNTWAGAQLGVLLGSLAAWLGMCMGSTLGFALARWLGHPMVRKLATPDDVIQLERLGARQGWLLLIATRPLPILAEATVLLLGAMHLRWSSFLLPMLLSNFALAFAYASIGAIGRSTGQLALVLIASVLMPLAATAVGRRLLSGKS
jgi:uncharacterized membrane protein YdjX (TVP38/TMEM64 family)